MNGEKRNLFISIRSVDINRFIQFLDGYPRLAFQGSQLDHQKIKQRVSYVVRLSDILKMHIY